MVQGGLHQAPCEPISERPPILKGVVGLLFCRYNEWKMKEK